MGKIKSGDKTGGKLKDKCRENSKGKKEVRFGVVEGAWFDQKLVTVRDSVHDGKTGGSQIGHSGAPHSVVLGEVAETCTHDPPRPPGGSKTRSRRKRGANGEERPPRTGSAKGRFTDAVPRPLGPRTPHSYPARRLPKWKVKPRVQRERPRQGVQRKGVLAPTDSRLENSDNYAIREWVCHKNELLKTQREDERKQRALEKVARSRREVNKQKRQKESEEKVKTWMMKKSLNRTERGSNHEGARGQRPTASPATVAMVGKASGQPPGSALMGERQVRGEKVEAKLKRSRDVGSGTPNTGILPSKDQTLKTCKTMSTLAGDSGPEAQTSNNKPANKNKSAHAEINGKSRPKSVHFKVAKKTSRSLGHAPQVKDQGYLVSRKGQHLVCQLPFNGRLSIKAKNIQPPPATMEGQEAKASTSKDLQNVAPKLENQQMQTTMDRKKSITITQETKASSSITLESGFTDVNAKRLQDPMVTPAVRSWFVHKLAESTVQSEGGQWSVRDGQAHQQVQPHTSSLYGISPRSVEDRLSALRLSHTFRDKKANEN
ncbi:uncharacterized protein LOC144603501 [Rhinoraja longicauda]